MNSKWLRRAALALTMGVGLWGYAHFRAANAGLRTQIAAALSHREATNRLRSENRQLEAFAAQARENEEAALRAIRVEAERAEADAKALERRAEERRAAKLEKDRATTVALATNRDLTKGPVLVENCTNAGRATAVDALQTLFWASNRGEDELVASMIALDGKSRAMVALLLATLPASAREKYSTPEKLAALIFADTLTKVSAVQVTHQKPLDSQHVALTIGSLSDKTADVVMELGPNGWQATSADRKIFDQFKAKLTGAPTKPATAAK